ncbi:hypothetical protein NT6N_09580 [Oceaniferula spumae]|uniref:PD-(D/E)XK endonuclease-like domain-containing protein n=1 Tax=Oceaniferula spumae TaxID=2979115 RepID=A0AAT9FIS7_9BACT
MSQIEFDLTTEPEVEASPAREFLGWDGPLLDSVTQWLVGLGDDLAKTLVVVPTTNSGRRLRMVLSTCGQDGGGVLAPHVMAPNRLFEVDGVASRQESLWAWIRTIQKIDVEEFPTLLPNHELGSTKSFSSALALARQMMTLRDQLADGDASFRDAGFQSQEKERWQELEKLESAMLQNLGKWKLRDSVLAKRDKAKNPDLITGVERVVVACVPDPTPLALRALKSFLRSGLPVTVLIHAPESEASCFDDWGTPVKEVWQQKLIDFPEWKERMHVVDSSTEAAQKCVEILTNTKTESDALALALCDPSFAPALEKTFTEVDWPLFDPEGRGLADSGLMRLLRVMRELAGDQASFESLQEFVRLPGADDFLPKGISRNRAAKLLDDLQLKHLPETVRDALALSKDDQAKEIINSIGEHISKLSSGTKSETLRTWLVKWLELTDDRTLGTSEAAEPRLAEVLDALDRLESFGETPTGSEVFEMMAESLHSAKASANRDQTVLDLQGWLEISYDPAPHLILAGMHEECVPDGTVDDVFVPDSLKQKLGLRDSDGRFARDAFLLHAALRSRDASGRVDAIVSRFNDAGEARKPSRLLMRQRGQQLPSIVQHLFAESESTAAKGGPWKRDWILDLPQAENPYLKDPPRRISPSALGDYLNCPLRFYLKRILGMNRYDSGKREMDAIDFGNLCHEVLEVFGSDDAVKDSVDEAEIREYLFQTLDDQIQKTYGTKLSLPLMVQQESARERLRAFAGKQAEDRALGWQIFATEFAVGRDRVGEETLEWKIGGHPLTMIVDRIDRHEDGNSWRVWDYKTSGKAANPEAKHLSNWNADENRPLLGELLPPSGRKKTERRWSNLQLPIYAAFVQDHFKTKNLPQVGYINLPRAVGEVGFTEWEEFDQQMLDHALAWASAAIDRIKAGEFQQAAVLSAGELEWDDFSELAPDGLAAAFGI